MIGQWIDDHPLLAFPVALVVVFTFLFAVVGMFITIGKPAEADPALPPLSNSQRDWAIECVKYADIGRSDTMAVVDCGKRARILGDRGWL